MKIMQLKDFYGQHLKGNIYFDFLQKVLDHLNGFGRHEESSGLSRKDYF